MLAQRLKEKGTLDEIADKFLAAAREYGVDISKDKFLRNGMANPDSAILTGGVVAYSNYVLIS